MDALEFLVKRKRLCASYKGCVGCPFGAAECVVRDMTSEDNCKRIITAVEQWSKDRPRKTRQSVFLEQYPEAQMIDGRGCLILCPKYISSDYRNNYDNCTGRVCDDCLLEFWMQEVE